MDESGYKCLDGAHAMYGYSAILPELRRERWWANERRRLCRSRNHRVPRARARMHVLAMAPIVRSDSA